MKRKNQLGLLFGMMLSIASIQPAMAISTAPVLASSTNIVIESNTSNPSWSRVHDANGCSGYSRYCLGGGLYQPLMGSLNAVLDTYTGGYEVALRNISGTLTSAQGTLTIHDGELRDVVSPGYAIGFLDYTLTGLREESGTFHFYNVGANRLTESSVQLWGNNWDPRNERLRDARRDESRSPLGLDLRGDFRTAPVPTPEPSTMLLLGSGLLALPFLRKKSQQA